MTIGDDSSGTHVLVNLELVGIVTLCGERASIREVLTALAIEMAASPMADFAVVHCIGFGAELPRALGTGRLRYSEDVDSALAGILARCSEVSHAIAESGAASLQRARGLSIASDAWAPEIILSALPLTDHQAETVAARIRARDTMNLAAVIAASASDTPDPGQWTLDAAPGRRVHLSHLERDVTLQRVTAEQYQQLIADLTIADDISGTEAGEPGQDELEPLEDSEPSAELEIRVLGPVEVAGRDVADIESGKRNLLPELAAYLRLNPGRSAEEVSKAMGGPRGPWAPATRASNMSRLRAWLGRDPDGRNYVPALAEGRLYRLADSVACDWDQFRKLARRGLADPSLAGTEQLRAALQLVRGEPFASAPPHSYIWAEFTRQEMISAITDVAHELAVRLTGAGDPAGARTAIARGLEVEPGSELLYRDLFRAEHRAGNAAGIEEAAERLMVTLAELDLDMEPETADLLNQLRGHRSPKARLPSQP